MKFWDMPYERIDFQKEKEVLLKLLPDELQKFMTTLSAWLIVEVGLCQMPL